MVHALVVVAIVLAQDGKSAAEEAVRAFHAAFSAKGATEAERAQAVQKLAETKHEETSKVLAKVLGCGQDTVAVEAAKGLSTFTDVKGVAARVAPWLSDPLLFPKPAVRVEIVKCLAALKDPAALPTLHRVLRDRDLNVAKEIVGALKILRHRDSVPVMIDYLKICERAPSGTIEIPIDIPKPKQDELDKDQLPTMVFWIRVDADAYARMRKELLHEPLLDALRTITKQKWETARGWSEWWGSAGPTFKVPIE